MKKKKHMVTLYIAYTHVAANGMDAQARTHARIARTCTYRGEDGKTLVSNPLGYLLHHDATQWSDLDSKTKTKEEQN